MFGRSAKLSSPRMNSRKINKSSGRKFLFFGARVLVWVAFLALGAYAIFKLPLSTQMNQYFKLAEIHYQGLVQVEEEDLDTIVRNSLPESILLIDLDRLRDLVKSESWIQEVRIRRRLPGELYIDVRERLPSAVAAIDNELYVVDRQGVILEPYGSLHKIPDRPIVRGLQNIARENANQENALRMKIYLQVVEELKSYSSSLSEINVENLQRVAVVPEEYPIPIYLGHDHFSTRYKTFISQKDLYERLKKQYGSIDSVDMTYDNKIIFHTPQEKGGTITAQSSKPS